MSGSPKLVPTKYDALVVLTVLLLAVALGARVWFAPAQNGAEIVVSVGGAEVERLPLADAKRDYTNNGYTIHVVVTAESVRVDHADCPTQDCVHTGAISRAGQSIVCLPARIAIALEGAADSGFDAIAG